MFYNITDVMKILGVGRSKGYQIIYQLNRELAKKGYLVVPGKVPKHYLISRYFIDTEDVGEV